MKGLLKEFWQFIKYYVKEPSKSVWMYIYVLYFIFTPPDLPYLWLVIGIVSTLFYYSMLTAYDQFIDNRKEDK